MEAAYLFGDSPAMRIGFLVLLKTFQRPLHPMGGVRRAIVGGDKN
jgi:hypothetical protein